MKNRPKGNRKHLNLSQRINPFEPLQVIREKIRVPSRKKAADSVNRPIYVMTVPSIRPLMNHINSEKRDSPNRHRPFKLSQFLLDHKLHKCQKQMKRENDIVKTPRTKESIRSNALILWSGVFLFLAERLIPDIIRLPFLFIILLSSGYIPTILAIRITGCIIHDKCPPDFKR